MFITHVLIFCKSLRIYDIALLVIYMYIKIVQIFCISHFFEFTISPKKKPNIVIRKQMFKETKHCFFETMLNYHCCIIKILSYTSGDNYI